MGALDNPKDVGPVKLAWLDRGGFSWIYDYSVWIDVAGKRILSFEYVSDQALSEIQADLREITGNGDRWKLLFHQPTSAEVVDAIIAKATGRS